MSAARTKWDVARSKGYRRGGPRSALCQLFTIFLLSLDSAGCAILPFYTAANKGPTTEWKPTRATERLSVVDLSHHVFVGVALSGGGSRAANFSAAVLCELQALGFVPHVAALSAV